MMCRRRLVLIVWLTSHIFVGQIEAKSNQNDTLKSVGMPHHSFAPPLDYSVLLGDWIVSGASIFERERLLLHPGVPERQGFAWNTRQLQTNNFEVVFDFSALGAKELSEVPADQSFAFWFVRQNISADFDESRVMKAPRWADGLREQGYELSGSKGLFEGLGVVFSVIDADKKTVPTVSFVSNDNHQTLVYGSDVPTRNAKAFDFRNQKPAELKFRVRPTSVQVDVQYSSVHEQFIIDRKNFPVKAGGYVGFTAWSGSEASGKTPDYVSVSKVSIVNFDDETIAEDVNGASEADKATYKDMMSEGAKHFEDSKSQSTQLGKLTTLLSKHITDTKPEFDSMSSSLLRMVDSVEGLEHDCRLVTTEMELLWHPKDKPADGKAAHQSHLKEMQNMLVGLKRLVTKEGASHMQKLEAVSQNVLAVSEQASKAAGSEVIGKLVDQTAKLEKTVDARGSQMSWMMFLLLGAVFCIGVLMYNRMNYYERKHFL